MEQKTYARVLDGSATNVVVGDPAEFFHADIAAEFIEVPEGTQVGATLAEDGWINPVQLVEASPPAEVRQVSPVQFKLLFTVQERVAIKQSEDPIVQDFFEIVNDARLTFVDLALQSTRDAIEYLASKGYVEAERIEQIMSGELR